MNEVIEIAFRFEFRNFSHSNCNGNMLRILRTILFIRNVIITYVYVYDTKSSFVMKVLVFIGTKTCKEMPEGSDEGGAYSSSA